MAQKGKPVVDINTCKGCLLCVKSCPVKILGVEAELSNHMGYHPMKVLDESRCIGCCNCSTICPDAAITVYKVS